MRIRRLLCVLFAWLCANVFAQDPVNGRRLYITPFGEGTLSCSASACHGSDPTQNVNRIQNGTTVADILYAIERFGVMAFLRTRVTNEQLADLAAYVANPAAATVARASLSSASVAFNPLFVGQSSRSERITVVNSGGAPLTISRFSVDNANFKVLGNGCTANRALQIGERCDIDVAFAPIAALAHAAQLEIQHNGQGGNSTVSLTGTARALPANVRLMVEFRIPSLDYYFITSRANEQQGLDEIPAFQRTGASFPVYAQQIEGARGLVRYYFDQIAKQATRGSHFYTLLDSEIVGLSLLNSTNTFAPRVPFNEGVDSYAFLPISAASNGSCAAQLQPVFRLFRGNARFPDDPNHRFTTDRRTFDEFVAAGWDNEGIAFCVPAPTP
jgi:Repeat of unknown function (DUF5648)